MPVLRLITERFIVDNAGNLRTSDFGGPYNLSLLNVQEAEVKSKSVIITIAAAADSHQ